MRHLNRYLGSLLLAAAIAAPTLVVFEAGAEAQGAAVQVRVYDRDHKDYHNWDDHENQRWGVFLSENHRRSHEFSRSSRREQSQYWKWRHNHPHED